MSTPIYTDKDYLDEQFRHIRADIHAARQDFQAKHKEHDEWHRRWGKRLLTAALALLGAGGIAWPK